MSILLLYFKKCNVWCVIMLRCHGWTSSLVKIKEESHAYSVIMVNKHIDNEKSTDNKNEKKHYLGKKKKISENKE
jgi:hypothetical protein